MQEYGYRQAHLSRDPRFDGKFYIGVKTTKIYCRPSCSAKMPLEKNVCYFKYQHEAVISGFRPCLRCKPDNAFSSLEWNKKEFVVREIARKMTEGEYLNIPIQELSSVYNYSDRYIRKIFQEDSGCKIKDYQTIQKALFARKLYLNSNLNTLEISLAVGYNSLGAFYKLMEKYKNLFDFKKDTKESKEISEYVYMLFVLDDFD
ncbi:Ada metal-binding domain-containing protein [Photobacterium damselae]|uniref:Ada metal-binding domain-containing protein n=1 Tax=Photobacterium damselae TaxID=38293 RepID=UPI001F1D05CF|nr:Ada metal-binding domain-containing protein [Photobacterium damselae]UKA03963.1 hypothetical protein IHC89_15655 [Photobacterium damselae subsp. damselae]